MRIFSYRLVVIWLIAFGAACTVWTLAYFNNNEVQRLHALVFDSYQRILPRQWAGTDVVVIDIDEASLKQMGQWPWPRTLVAELTDRLGSLGAAAIVFDVLFPETDRTSPVLAIERLRKAGAEIKLPQNVEVLDNDLVLAEAFARNVVVTGLVFSADGTRELPAPKAGYGFSGSLPSGYMVQDVKAIRNIPVLDAAATGIGDISFLSTGDGVVRKSVLLKPANNRYYPNLAMEALRVVQGASAFKLKSSDGSGEISGSEVSIVSVQVGALTVQTDEQGALDIYHSSAAEKPTLSAVSVLRPTPGSLPDLRREIASHIVLIGTSAQGLLDLWATPLNPVVPGVSIHADIIDQIVSQTYITRPDTASGIELVSSLVLVIILITALPLLRSLGGVLLTVVLLSLAIGVFWRAFSDYQLLFSPVLPVFSLLAAYGTSSAANLFVAEKDVQFIRNAFAHYLAPALVERLASDPEQLTLGGEERELTILFCDIRSFTTISESMSPIELTQFLNDFHTSMTTVLLEREATIDKYMGDAIMAFWNAPVSQEQHHRLACQGVLDMRKALRALNANAPRKLEIGIGLNTGHCCVGNLGSSQRFNYSAIGDAVNVASRAEGLTKQYGLDNLVVEETVRELDEFALLEIDKVSVVGRNEPIRVYTLLGDHELKTSDTFAELCDVHGKMLQTFRAADFERALEHLEAFKAMNFHGMKKLCAFYQNRLTDLSRQGVPDNWNGVFVSDKK